MKIAADAVLIERARGGDMKALDALLRQLERPLYNLAARMLGHREDARDATQEVLLKVTTHLGSWKQQSAFGTWVYSIASHHLLNLKTRAPAAPASLDELGAALDDGLAWAQRVGFDAGHLSAEDRLAARRVALSCTQAMLLALEPAGRLSYVLDVIFGLDSDEAAQIQNISPAAHRQRLSRARAALHGFMERRCGLVSKDASCRCAAQVPGKRVAEARGARTLEVSVAELDAAEAGLRELEAMGDAAAVMRGAPVYAAPESLLDGIRRVVERSALLKS